MNKKFLDSNIILYENNIVSDQLNLIKLMSEKTLKYNLWEISSSKNINNTDLTNNCEIFDLVKVDFLLNQRIDNFIDIQKDLVSNEKMKLKNKLNELALPLILDYLKDIKTLLKGEE